MYSSKPVGGGTPVVEAARQKITAPALRARKGARPIAVVTAYDYTMAQLLDRAGVDALLVGDSLGNVIQGLDSTIPVTVQDVCYHTRAVARGAPHAHVIADMPFMSFQVSAEEAVRNAGLLVKEGMAESVKLEGGVEMAETVERIVQAGIPVMGHVGLTPQAVHALGGYKVQGQARHVAERILAGAEALAEAGAYAIVLEAVPPDLAELITRRVSVPTIGIGAGVGCDGQVLVCYDLLGMNLGHTPRFAKRYGELGDRVTEAAAEFVREVRERAFPAREHCYKPAGHQGLGEPADDPADAVIKLVM
jgi:3-methyl-2-oxobutanoate hydroxymethyltransferase